MQFTGFRFHNVSRTVGGTNGPKNSTAVVNLKSDLFYRIHENSMNFWPTLKIFVNSTMILKIEQYN